MSDMRSMRTVHIRDGDISGWKIPGDFVLKMIRLSSGDLDEVLVDVTKNSTRIGANHTPAKLFHTMYSKDNNFLFVFR
jgi:hypothetical protein